HLPAVKSKPPSDKGCCPPQSMHGGDIARDPEVEALVSTLRDGVVVEGDGADLPPLLAEIAHLDGVDKLPRRIALEAHLVAEVPGVNLRGSWRDGEADLV